MKGRLALSLESTSARMGRLGRAILQDQPLLDEDEIAARIDAVTIDDVAALAGELFAPARLSAAGIGHDEEIFTSGARRAARGGGVTRVAVVGATGRLGAPICSGIEAADDLTLVARVARSLDAGGTARSARWRRRSRPPRSTSCSRPAAPSRSAENVRIALEHGIAVVAGATGPDDATWAALGDLAASAACRCTRCRTSRSAPC